MGLMREQSFDEPHCARRRLCRAPDNEINLFSVSNYCAFVRQRFDHVLCCMCGAWNDKISLFSTLAIAKAAVKITENTNARRKRQGADSKWRSGSSSHGWNEKKIDQIHPIPLPVLPTLPLAIRIPTPTPDVTNHGRALEPHVKRRHTHLSHPPCPSSSDTRLALRLHLPLRPFLKGIHVNN